MGLNLMQLSPLQVQAIATVVKFAVILGMALNVPPIMIWAERRIPALWQRRKGPNRVGLFQFRIFGLLQSLADAMKLAFKEEIVTDAADKVFYHLAPIIALFPAVLVVMAIPFGPGFYLGEHWISMSAISVDVGFIFILAISSLAVYGVALAGWASNNKYSLMGSLRASAQMISYEIPLGMSLIPVVLLYQTLDLNQIVIMQKSVWTVFSAPVSFVVFFICMFAETNRAPFDLAEGESELVAGFHTEYNSMKFAQFFLAEYISMFTLSALCATVFFGGWQIPFVSQEQLLALVGNEIIAAVAGMMVLLLKAVFFLLVFIWVRWTLPRFRYDQLMGLGWKFLMPVALVNIVITAIILAFYRF
jgi:NADH-quinone oxidoreductase subunit H